MEFSKALQEMIKLIQTGGNCIEEYELMLADFIVNQEDGETVRMSFEIARQRLVKKQLDNIGNKATS